MASVRKKFVIGIDEVGRGALAGPVVVAAYAYPAGRNLRFAKLGELRDSKKLSPKKRELWSRHLRAREGAYFAVSFCTPSTVDRINISAAANRASARALFSVLSRAGAAADECAIVLDGGLYLKNRAVQNKRFANAATVVKADERCPAVAAASILAKVQRDAYMVRAGAKFPGYGFAHHKGYGTLSHRQAIGKLGQCPLHRSTFVA